MWYLGLYQDNDDFNLKILDQDPKLEEHRKGYHSKYKKMISYMKIRSEISLNLILGDFKKGQKKGLNLHDVWYQLNSKYSSQLASY